MNEKTKVMDSENRSETARARRLIVFRILAVATIAAGIVYLGWRYTASLNFDPRAVWFSLLLVAAETYSFVDSLLFILMM